MLAVFFDAHRYTLVDLVFTSFSALVLALFICK